MPSLPRRMASSTPRSWRTPVSPVFRPTPPNSTETIANDSGRRCPAVGRPNSANSGGSWRLRSPGPVPIACSTTSPPRVSAKRSCGGCYDSRRLRTLCLAPISRTFLALSGHHPLGFPHAFASDRLICGASTPGNPGSVAGRRARSGTRHRPSRRGARRSALESRQVRWCPRGEDLSRYPASQRGRVSAARRRILIDPRKRSTRRSTS